MSSTKTTQEIGMAGTFEIFKDNKGEYRFRLKSRNGEIVASGESYPTKAGVRRAIQAVQRAAADAKIDDKSGD